MVRKTQASGTLDRWFFIRYADPDSHIRLRLHGSPERLRNEVWPALEELLTPLMESDCVWRVQLDTYEREIERYGGRFGIDLAEALFQLDSETVLALLPSLQDDSGDKRWRVAFFSIHQMLADLGLDLSTRCRVLKTILDGLKAEFVTQAAFDHQLGRKYRAMCSELTTLIAPSSKEQYPLAESCAIVAERSSRLGELGQELETRSRSGLLTEPLESLAMSFMHMNVNRVLSSSARAQELVLYDFLVRQYTSQLAQAQAHDTAYRK